MWSFHNLAILVPCDRRNGCSSRRREGRLELHVEQTFAESCLAKGARVGACTALPGKKISSSANAATTGLREEGKKA